MIAHRISISALLYYSIKYGSILRGKKFTLFTYDHTCITREMGNLANLFEQIKWNKSGIPVKNYKTTRETELPCLLLDKGKVPKKTA